MTLNTYQTKTRLTRNENLTFDEKLSNYALGISGEAGEVADYIKKHLYQGHDLDKNYVKKELGDILWYVTSLTDILGLTLDEIMECNIDKLLKRYKNGFTVEESINRKE
jgi:NTP pyrophosphatase (non-canonical NTP hydrolase)